RERLRARAKPASSVERVHVVGAGVMGGDIAAWCVLNGLTVTLQDRAMAFVEPALERAAALFKRRLKAPGAAAAAGERLQVDLQGARIGEADVVIEAIVERLDAKQALFAELEPRIRAGALLATNTSSLPLESVASGIRDPGRFVGLHFFNPVARLPLVEVIRTEATEPAFLEAGAEFVARLGKLPLVCRSAPGFVVNRVLAPYMFEALRAYQDGVALETIDRAAERFGMPTGPVELADRVGLDVALHVTHVLGAALGATVPALLQAKVDAGELGAKTGQGFYRFENGRPRKATAFAEPDAQLQDRLILALVNEAMACYEDGVVEELDLLDAGIVFGTGFAPFTGGPIHYARQCGIEAIIGRLESLAEAFGPRFAPRPGWRKLL
ncbi:MAG: 3-hydroxyacyl-CoA dehydrogenase family protein, partial [Rhodospirillaceae bacterium]|nr:3-hydroxyacyl-CoA dehydrogenase family protein [Rhodospirillaceae bacterium]